VAQRAQHDLIEKTTDVYLADTIGELGLFYRLGRTVFLGGSLVPIGGHNPIEPIKLGCAVIWGAHIQKTRDIADVFGSTIRMVSSTSELTAAIADDLSNPLAADQRSKAALKVLDQQASALDKVCEVLRGIV
jgi:3-deoxy-D-manno-octulosonic-acid transferase